MFSKIEELSKDLRMCQRPMESMRDPRAAKRLRSYIDSGPAKGLEGSRYGKTDNGELTAIMAES